MPRSPDFLLGFGFTSKDRGLLRYLKTVKQSLTSVHQGFEEIEKTTKDASTGKESISQGIKSVSRATTERSPKMKRQFRQHSMGDRRSFVDRLKEVVSPKDEKKSKIERMEKVLNALSRRYQDTGEKLNTLRKYSAAYSKELRRAKFATMLDKIGDGFQDVTEKALRFIGLREGWAKFMVRTMPKGISLAVKGVGALGKAVGRLLTSGLRKKRGLPDLFSPKKKLFEGLFFRRKDVSGITHGIQGVQKAMAAQASKASPGAAIGDEVQAGIEKAKKKLAKLDVGGSIVRSVKVAMERTKVILEKANLKKKLDAEFVKAKDKVNGTLGRMQTQVKRAFGKNGIGGAMRSSSSKINGTLTKMSKRFAKFSDSATESIRGIIPPMREAALELKGSFDGMWSNLKHQGKSTFDAVIQDKEKFVKKFDKNFRDLASKTETNLGRIGTEAGQQFSKMSSTSRKAFEQMGEKLEGSITESVRSARRDVGAAQSDVMTRAGRVRRSRKPEQQGLISQERMPQMDEMIQKLMELVRPKSIEKGDTSSDFSKIPQFAGDAGLHDVVQAIHDLSSSLGGRVGRVEGAIFRSAPQKGLIGFGDKGEGGGSGADGLLSMAKFIPQLRGLGFLKGLMK